MAHFGAAKALLARAGALHPAWVGVIAALLYAPSVTYGFLNYDEPWLIQNNQLLKDPSWSGVWTILFDLRSDARFRLGAEYLPVRDFSVMLDHALFGGWAQGHHLMNVLLYGAMVALSATATLAWWKRRDLAWLTGLVFAAHPVHVEAVAWLAERKGLLAGTFAFAALTVLHRAFTAEEHISERARVRSLCLSLVLFALGVWSKAPTVAVLAALPALLATAPEVRVTRRDAARAAVWCGAAFATFVPAYLAGKHMQMVQPYHAGGFVGTLSLAAAIHAKYVALGLFFGPYNIAYPIDAAGDAYRLLGALLALGLVGVVVAALRGRAPRAGFAAWWWLATLSPVSQVVFPIQNLMADRYLLLPSYGLCFAVAVGLLRLRTRLRAYVTALLLIVAVSLTWLQLAVWRDSASLYTHAVQVDPRNASSWNQLANIFTERGDLDGAWAVTEEGLRHSPDHWRLLHRRALLLARSGRLDEAIGTMRRAAAQPGAATARANLALLLVRKNQKAEAERWARAAAADDPRDAHHRRTLGVVLLGRGKVKEARAEFEAAVKAEPWVADNYLNLGLALLSEGEEGAADRAFREAVRLKPALAKRVSSAKAERAARAGARSAPPPSAPSAPQRPGERGDLP